MKQTVVFDFDGVVHSYTSGWKGENIIPDSPVTGIKEAIDEIRKAGYEVIIVSTRCAHYEGQVAILEWLRKYQIAVDDVCKEKPPAIVYIDDRAICFDGNPTELLSKIKDFEPWTAKSKKKEQVNHPAHYNIPGRKECIEEMIDKWGSELTAIWCEMTAYKYEYRAGLKDGNSKEQDTAKRDWYLHKAMEIRAVPRMTVPVAASAAMPASMPVTVELTAKNANDAAEQIRKQIEKSMYGELGLNYGA